MRCLTRNEWRPLYAIWRADKLHLPKEYRIHAVRGCAGKMRYDSREEAVPIAKALEPRPGKSITIYGCLVCTIDGQMGYHIGNSHYVRNMVNGRYLPPKES